MPVLAVCVASVALIGSGCAALTVERPKPVTVPEIVELSKAGVPAADIIAKMSAAGTVYRLSASQLSNLARDGVAGEVIDYMQETYIGAVRLEAVAEERRHWIMWHGHWNRVPGDAWTPWGRPSHHRKE
jgi:hypothetical protein